MTTDGMFNIIKKLGVEFEEVFMIDYGDKNAGSRWYDNFFKFTEDGLYKIGADNLTICMTDICIEDLLSGKSKIIKFWKPKIGEIYYIPSFSNTVYEYYLWSGSSTDYNYLYQGIVCKTKYEAAALSKDISAVTRRWFVIEKRTVDNKAKNVDNYDYLNLFD